MNIQLGHVIMALPDLVSAATQGRAEVSGCKGTWDLANNQNRCMLV